MSACSSSPPGNSPGDFKACMLSGVGNINDRGFNQSAWEGLQAGVKELSLPAGAAKVLVPKTQADVTPQLQALVALRCDLIVGVGFELADTMTRSAEANPNRKFGIVDVDVEPVRENIASLVFADAQASFLGGYGAASISKTGTVGTFGGISSPAVNGWLDGYVEGVAYYNKQHGTDVRVVGWDEKSQQGLYAGSYRDSAKGKQLAEQLVSQGADVIFPVAGNTNLGAAQAGRERGVTVLWPDTDGCKVAASFCDVFLGSALKNVADAVTRLVVDTRRGKYAGGPHVGTVENGGVAFIVGTGAAGGRLTSEVAAEIRGVKAGLGDGRITIRSTNLPQAG